jgi:polyphosphate glucokinase
MDEVLGIDVGGSGIKGAVVDLATGSLRSDRLMVDTPSPATPPNVGEAVSALAGLLGWRGRAGCGLPGVVQQGTLLTAPHLDPSWIGFDARALLGEAVGGQVTILNDADAAGLAEMQFGAAAGRSGVVLLLTFGTGIGSALLVDGRLVPNTEFGHLELWGGPAEIRASANSRISDGLLWGEWAARVGEYLAHLERLLWPDLIVIGGGISRSHDEFIPLLHTRAPVVPALLRNDAGIVGAALAAFRQREDS